MKSDPMGLLSGTLIEKEIELELDAVRSGVARYRDAVNKAVSRGDGSSLKPAERLIAHWYHIFLWAIREERKSCQRGETGFFRQNYAAELLSIDAKAAALVGMRDILSISLKNAPAGIKMISVAESVGRSLNAELNLQLVKDDDEAWSELMKTDRRKIYPQHVIRISKKRSDDYVHWTRKQRICLGMCLIRLLIDVASCDDYEMKFVPAFENRLVRSGGGKRQAQYRMLLLTPEALKLIEDGHAIRQHLKPRYLPMVCPPLPWTDHSTGGYLKLRTELVKRAAPEHRELLEDVDQRVLDAINYIGSQKFSIDRLMYDSLDSAYHSSVEWPGIPSITDEPLPPKPPTFDTSLADRRAWKRQAVLIHRGNVSRRSERMAFNARMAVAEDFVDYKGIYFPHHLDARGRTYPLPIYLNHHGEDTARSMLKFGDDKPLGKRGLWWLKVQAANSYGVDDVSFEDRVAWVDAALDSVVIPAAEDFMANRLWAEADKPWQFLAACREIHSALLCPGGPENAVSALPVQQDGKCNALQHYAALGRDSVAAALTSVAPGDKPSDIYTLICERVNDRMREDAAKGHKLALTMLGKVERKTVKTPVMTKTYGVTAIGARRQVEEKIKDMDVPRDQVWNASKYVSELALSSMADVCVKATEIMDWFQDCVGRISKAGEMPYWLSPIGFPVYQDYYKATAKAVHTGLQRIFIAERSNKKPRPRTVKHKNAAGPNLIHHIDATHLMMTAIRCWDEQIAFATVHDSFWTHPCDVDRLHKIIREEFVALHEQDILGDIVEQFRTAHPKIEFPDPPARGDFDIKLIMNSHYLFS